MYRKSRLDEILEIMRKNGYITVKYLSDRLHYSTATINRDLNLLEKQQLIIRSYGGAELVKTSYVPLAMRYHKAHAAKNRIAKKAADLIRNGETVFIDGSSTTEYMGKYMTEKKEITVITNNMALATYLSDHAIRVILLGGEIAEPPSILGGMDTVENAMKYSADKLFFSVSSIQKDGTLDSGVLAPLLRVLIKRAGQTYLLADKAKFRHPASPYVVSGMDALTGIISDGALPDALASQFPHVSFYKV